jgi:hypothetical protein
LKSEARVEKVARGARRAAQVLRRSPQVRQENAGAE